MSKYSTGEIARLCGVSVRTVQFYDSKGLLTPSEISEGGRRLYCQADVEKLRFICMLKTLGLSLDAIKEILGSEQQNEILLLLLEQQEKRICQEVEQREKQLTSIRFLRETLKNEGEIPAQSLCDIEQIMENKKGLRTTHGIMLAVGILMDLIQLVLLALWLFRGIWVPFAVGMPFVIAMGVWVTRFYYRRVSYVCPHCHAVFRPKFREFLFAKHTPKARCLTCTQCGKKDYCVEQSAG